MFLRVSLVVLALSLGVGIGYLATRFLDFGPRTAVIHYCYPNSQDDVCKELDRQYAESKRAHRRRRGVEHPSVAVFSRYATHARPDR
jgi:hypothetical protein